jgi:crotonobetainyl-CoA:carnitine CoA-transferase CaiB-like acyl-CoA transferase
MMPVQFHVPEPAAPSALAGLRVLDLATVVAGPATSKYLADFGADVIKVERPGGDSTRTMGWVAPGDDDSLFWKLLNRGKRSVTLDLADPADRDSLLSLAEHADVIVENMRPGKLEKLGLGPDVLLACNPRVVVVRVTGFGQTGPYAQKPGFATIAEAMSGYASITGEPGGPPLLPPIALTDEITALAAAFATMVAVRHAERTGSGQVVDISLLESILQIMGPLPAAWQSLGYQQPRLGSGLPFSIPRGAYRCADGQWVALSATAESVAARVLTLIGLGDDERLGDFAGRVAHRELVETTVRDWIEQRSSPVVLESFERVDAAITLVNSMADVVADPHVAARRALIEVDGILMQNVIAHLSLTPGEVRHAGPPLSPPEARRHVRFEGMPPAG